MTVQTRHADSETPDRASVGRGGATRGALLGSMFLMATSAIGPGFITQTTVFTAELGAAFALTVYLGWNSLGAIADLL